MYVVCLGFINFLFPFSIKNTTNYKNFLDLSKIKPKSGPQSKIEPLPNLHLDRQHINLKMNVCCLLL